MQKNFFFYYKPEYRNELVKTLLKTGRRDLIAKLGIRK